MRTIINIASSYARFIIGMVIVFLLTPYTLNIVGIDQFGLWSLCLSVAGLLALLDMGFSTATVKYVAECNGSHDHEARNQAVSTLFLVYTGLGIICLLLVLNAIPYGISVFELDQDEALVFTQVMQISGAAVAVSLPLCVFRSLLIGAGRYDIVNIAEIIGIVLNALLVVFLLNIDLGLNGLAIANASVLLVVPLILAPLAYRLIPDLKLRVSLFRFHRLRELVPLSVYFMIANIAMLVILRSDALIIKGFMSLSAVAAFAIAARIAEYTYLLNKQFSNALMPLVSHSVGSGNRDTINAILVDGTRLLSGIATLLIGLLYFHADSIISLWVGDELQAAVLPLKILLAAVMFSSLQLNAANVLGMSGGHRGVAWTMLGSAILNILLSLMLIPLWGLIGAATATLAAAMVMEFFLILPRACRHQQISLLRVLRGISPALIASVPMFATAHILQSYWPVESLLQLCLQGTGAAIVFLVVYLFIGLRGHERKQLVTWFRWLKPPVQRQQALSEGSSHV